jgi:iron complex transport system ATP-binding protein
MDLDHQEAMGRLLKELAAEGYSVILVSHDFNVASEWADSALLLRKGEKVACGPMRDILTELFLKSLYPDSGLVVGANPATGAPKVFFGRA